MSELFVQNELVFFFLRLSTIWTSIQKYITLSKKN